MNEVNLFVFLRIKNMSNLDFPLLKNTAVLFILFCWSSKHRHISSWFLQLLPFWQITTLNVAIFRRTTLPPAHWFQIKLKYFHPPISIHWCSATHIFTFSWSLIMCAQRFWGYRPIRSPFIKQFNEHMILINMTCEEWAQVVSQTGTRRTNTV